ncbi:MAG: cobalamin-dependent protein, partial [Planctomycetota bacterium]
MNILLIDPPFYRFFNYYNRYFPLGLCYLASTLKNAGHRVTIYDADCNKTSDATASVKRKGMDYSRLPEKYRIYLQELKNPSNPIIQEISKTLERCQPDLVGITVMTPKAASAFTIASLVKKRLKGCRVVFGGPHATLMPEEILKNTSDVDFVISGEGENVLLELVNILSARNRDTQTAHHEGDVMPDISKLGGISYCCNGKRVHQSARRFIDDLDTLPLPDREALLGADIYTSEDSGLLMGSRGCPYNCSYCAT